ncbi:MarR family transcriptional regulator [Vibrio nigripulchritudo ATCC 27043]|uniref:Bacterial regulatory protein, MarR family n=1 Tax=Vibrio nigripulchritudo SOn1 TaxID=1238450 RepID=A0AAV2VSI9_9VIBR|nr:MarR family transcriptional regulator [Vibrio nigripulchritudo]EGU59470.1 MarR family transcriptional regulator [Vibrio nigripulchritudo ATCC 27043]CCO47369.1 putative Bacterial regulatory protein, MarR family [Vibrio nigripulchritudo SOn1]
MDKVDTILRQWREQRPDLDPSSMAILGRISQLRDHIAPKLNKTFSEFGLNSGEFDVLMTLRRSGDPYTLCPHNLLQSMMLTSGAMTNRIDKLESKGLVVRSADPNDRRGVQVSLTEEGLALANKAVEAHIENSETILTGLDKEERDALAILLSKLLASQEKED